MQIRYPSHTDTWRLTFLAWYRHFILFTLYFILDNCSVWYDILWTKKSIIKCQIVLTLYNFKLYNFKLFGFPIFRFWAYLMKVILSVPDEGYSSNVPDEGYSRNVPDEGYSRNVPDEGYSRNASWPLNVISTFLFLYTSIPHTLLKSRIKELIQHCFLLLVETNLTLSKAIQNLIININRSRSFKC